MENRVILEASRSFHGGEKSQGSAENLRPLLLVTSLRNTSVARLIAATNSLRALTRWPFDHQDWRNRERLSSVPSRSQERRF